MSVFMMVIGIAVTLFALLTIVFSNKRIDKRTDVLDSYELSLIEMKKEIEELNKRVHENTVEKLKELDKLIKECDRRVLMFDNKIKEGKNMSAILERSYEKTSEIKVNSKVENRVESPKKEFTKSDIIELYKNGNNLKVISDISGKSLEEIAKIMGIS